MEAIGCSLIDEGFTSLRLLAKFTLSMNEHQSGFQTKIRLGAHQRSDTTAQAYESDADDDDGDDDDN